MIRPRSSDGDTVVAESSSKEEKQSENMRHEYFFAVDVVVFVMLVVKLIQTNPLWMLSSSLRAAK